MTSSYFFQKGVPVLFQSFWVRSRSELRNAQGKIQIWTTDSVGSTTDVEMLVSTPAAFLLTGSTTHVIHVVS